MFAPFTHHCTACDRDQLIFPSMVSAVTPTDGGNTLAFECWCGAHQTALDELPAPAGATLAA